tara:strand:- start:266 stop:985 length:720 start_codon:yes stop_codon:yes gene_type:complete
MKILKSQLLQLIKEETQGEMEFAELEAARQNYLQDKNDETRYQFGRMVEKLVEPIMNELGLFFEAEAFYNRGEIVFSNNRDTEVIIDPDGMRGRYDVQVVPLPGAEDDVSPSEISVPTMKGVAQYVADLRNLDPEPAGMVGEPKAQTELPLENKMRITKTRLQKIIKEEIKRALNEDFDKVMRMAMQILGPNVELDEEMDGNIIIVADEEDIEEKYGELMNAFPDGEMTEDGFVTGVMG